MLLRLVCIATCVQFALTVIHPTEALSQSRLKKICDAVQLVAEIEYDDEIIVAVAKDNENDICSFSASMPPPSQSKAASAYEALSTVWKVTSNFNIETVKNTNIGQLAVEAMLAPLESGAFSNSDKIPLLAAAETNIDAIDLCAFQSVTEKREFAPINDELSCGMDWPSDRFAVELRAATLVVSVALPIPRR